VNATIVTTRTINGCSSSSSSSSSSHDQRRCWWLWLLRKSRRRGRRRTGNVVECFLQHFVYTLDGERNVLIHETMRTLKDNPWSNLIVEFGIKAAKQCALGRFAWFGQWQWYRNTCRRSSTSSSSSSSSSTTTTTINLVTIATTTPRSSSSSSCSRYVMISGRRRRKR
jgi:hypothetical protein